MIPEKIKQFIETMDYAVVASAGADGKPHLATGQGLRIKDDNHIVFTAWFCHKTLENVAANPQIALILAESALSTGYQLIGTVERTSQSAFLNGYAPKSEAPGTPQMESQLVIRIESILEFSAGPHTDNQL